MGSVVLEGPRVCGLQGLWCTGLIALKQILIRDATREVPKDFGFFCLFFDVDHFESLY